MRLGRRWAFCEAARPAGATMVRHVRRLGATGLHWDGGCDTPALCGAAVAWDRREPVTMAAARARDVCPACSAALLSL